jgi:hypothetical protein
MNYLNLVPRQAATHLIRSLLKNRCFLLCTTVVSLQALLLGPAQSRQRYTSINGFATIIFGSQCSTRKPTGFYQFRDGTKGTLTSLDCSQQGGDVFTHRFYDTAGSERCQGAMTTIYGGRSRYGMETRWEVKSAVPGFSCSQAGKSFKLQSLKEHHRFSKSSTDWLLPCLATCFSSLSNSLRIHALVGLPRPQYVL